MFTIAELFKMQDTLNERIGFDAKHFAEVFSQNPNSVDKQQSKIEAGIWIDDLLKAMSSEMEELRGTTLWKHWCSEAQAGRRYEIKDVEAARKEVIDMFHFWISLAQVLGMTAEMTCGMYVSKLGTNIKRQDDGYSIEVKDKAWALYQKQPNAFHVASTYKTWSEPTSFEDLLESEQRYFLKQAKNIKRQYSSEVKDLAWSEFQEHPDQNPALGSLTAESFEDLPSDAQKYYTSWAKSLLDPIHSRPDCTFPALQNDGCRLCGKYACERRAVENKYCDCIDEKFNNGPKEDTSSILPQPDPDCKKCGGTGYAS